MSSLPYLLPLIEFGSRHVPHVVVVVGAERLDTCRADEALLMAALAGGAEIVPAGDEETQPDGVAALLRHA